jgi:hypothetical protein
VSDKKQDVGPGDPLYYAPRWVRERTDQTNRRVAQHEADRKGWSAPPDHVADLRHVSLRDQQAQKQPDVFAEAVARAERESRESILVEGPRYLLERSSIGIAAKFAVAVSVAIVISLVYVIAFPASQGLIEDRARSGLQTSQSLKAPLFSPPQRKAAPTLIVRDNSGAINEPLGLGVSVEAAAPGASVTIKRMPADAKLTAGRRMSASEWRVPAQEISDAAIIPPTDFVGELKLSAELQSSDGATLATTFVRLIWTSAAPAGGPLPASASAATASPGPVVPGPVVPAQQQAQTMASPPAAAPVTTPAATPLAATTPVLTPPAPVVTAPALPTPQARAEPTQELSANEIAALVRRAQELLASGDLQDARTLLTRAAEAHDARAALLLAKTFDPMTSRQLGAADQGPDLAQARDWYQRAREWGSPEAQRQLDALASYPRH